MAQNFVPFAAFAANPSAGEAEPTASQQFVPMPSPSSAPPANERPAQGHQPTVKLEKEGETIRRIQIQCSCGQVIDLDCAY